MQQWLIGAGTNACAGTWTRCQDDLALAANGPGMKNDANAQESHEVVGMHCVGMPSDWTLGLMSDWMLHIVALSGAHGPCC